jgi:hypothetical protein
MSKQAANAHTPIPLVLSVVGDELGHLAADVERLHAVVEVPGVREQLRAAQCFDVLQSIDHVTQHLAALSEFLASIAATTPGHWAVDTSAACDGVVLASLCDRLKQPTLPRSKAAGQDECEFF